MNRGKVMLAVDSQKTFSPSARKRKAVLSPIFVAISLCFSVIAKDKTWLSILLSMMVGMFVFMMIPMITPLDAGLMNVILCLAGSVLFSLTLGLTSNLVLNKTALV